MTGLAVPDVWRVFKASTEDVNSFVAPIAVHQLVCVVTSTTQDAWIPGLDGEQLVFHDHARVEFGFLDFVLHGIGVQDRTSDGMAQLHHVEDRATYWATVGSFDPRFKTGVVQVVLARQQMGNRFFVGIETRQ